MGFLVPTAALPSTRPAPAPSVGADVEVAPGVGVAVWAVGLDGVVLARTSSPDVLGVCDRLQVTGVATRPVRALCFRHRAVGSVAQVIQFHPWWDRANHEFVHRPVGKDILAVPHEVAVARTVATSGEPDAPVGVESKTPEQVLWPREPAQSSSRRVSVTQPPSVVTFAPPPCSDGPIASVHCAMGHNGRDYL